MTLPPFKDWIAYIRYDTWNYLYTHFILIRWLFFCSASAYLQRRVGGISGKALNGTRLLSSAYHFLAYHRKAIIKCSLKSCIFYFISLKEKLLSQLFAVLFKLLKQNRHILNHAILRINEETNYLCIIPCTQMISNKSHVISSKYKWWSNLV